MENCTPFHMLAEAVHLAIGPDRNIDLAVKLIHAARELASEDQSFHVAILAMAAMEQVSLSMLASGAKKTPSTHTEYGLVQSWFKKNHADLVPGSSLEKIKAGRYMPDFMLKIPSGHVVPVECKKTFNARSLRQLQAYMDHFDSDFGYAVGCRLDVELPENVVFFTVPKDHDRCGDPRRPSRWVALQANLCTGER